MQWLHSLKLFVVATFCFNSALKFHTKVAPLFMSLQIKGILWCLQCNLKSSSTQCRYETFPPVSAEDKSDWPYMSCFSILTLKHRMAEESRLQSCDFKMTGFTRNDQSRCLMVTQCLYKDQCGQKKSRAVTLQRTSDMMWLLNGWCWLSHSVTDVSANLQILLCYSHCITELDVWIHLSS